MTKSITITAPTFNFSVESYHKLADVGILKPTDKVELIAGKIIKRAKVKSVHSATVCRLSDLFRYFLLAEKKEKVSEGKAITLGTHSEPEPDITITKYREDYYEEAHPTEKDIFVVIEVSLSTQKYDRETKIPLYASYNIPEAWIVDLKAKTIEVYEDPKGEAYTSKKVFGLNDILTSSFVKELTVNRVIKSK